MLQATARSIDRPRARARLKDRVQSARRHAVLSSTGYGLRSKSSANGVARGADIYGVGAMLLPALDGQHPFPDDDLYVIASADSLVIRGRRAT